MTAEPPIPQTETTAIDQPKAVIMENKPIVIERVVESDIESKLDVSKTESNDTQKLKTIEPTKTRKVREDKGKPRKHLKILKNKKIEKTISERGVRAPPVTNKPKSSMGFKVGITLGIIAGIFGAIFAYNYIKNKYLKPKIEVKEIEESKPQSEEDRINSLYCNFAKSDMD